MKNKWTIVFSLLCASLSSQEAPQQPAKIKTAPAEYVAKDYSYLMGMPGFSDPLLKLHFQLYQGYVKNTNLLLSRLKDMELQDKDLTYDYGALKTAPWMGMGTE